MQDILRSFSLRAVIPALEQNFIRCTLAYARTAGKDVHEEPEITWTYTGTHLSYFNGVLQTILSASNADATIAKMLDYFQSRRQLMSWWVTPSSRPKNLAQRLEAHGLKLTMQDIGMAVDLHRLNETLPVPPGVTIERVRDTKTMQEWTQAFACGFELDERALNSYSELLMSVPPDRHPLQPYYLARLNGQPVATSALYCEAGVAGIYEVCTIPSARRSGIGSAVVLAALRDARAMGYRIAVLQASSMGKPIYQRLGFSTYCTFYAYQWRP